MKPQSLQILEFALAQDGIYVYSVRSIGLRAVKQCFYRNVLFSATVK